MIHDLTLSGAAIALALILASARTPAQAPPAVESAGSLPAESRQVLLVITEGWDATTGTLQRFERSRARAWRSVGKQVPVVVGRTGLAWGRGSLVEGTGGPIKREGDGKSPAGVFRLGTAFGQSPRRPRGLRLSYLYLGDNIECVDDRASRHYNQLTSRARVERQDWASSEQMWTEPLYRRGVVVDYNPAPAEPGAGSCIFLHVWRGPASVTAGCTAMAEPSLADIMKWLDPRKKPLLVQLPREQYARMKQRLFEPASLRIQLLGPGAVR